MPAKTQTEQKVQELFNQISEGTKAVFTGENYRRYLVAMSKFHQYSFRNVLLIYAQCPQATRIAGYNKWRSDFQRQVKKGETAIRILGYTPYKRRVQEAKRDSTGRPIMGTDGKPIIEEKELMIPAYKPVSVFDVSQTEGEPLPELVTTLTKPIVGYYLLSAALSKIAELPVTFENIPGSANGYCDHINGKIAVQQGMSQSQTMKTLVHECAHAHLHDRSVLPQGETISRESAEVEAESVAFIVCQYLGMDTTEYSFPYIAGWASTREVPELQNGLEKIQKTANQFIEKIESESVNLHNHKLEHPLVWQLPDTGYLTLTPAAESVCVTRYDTQMNQIDQTALPADGRSFWDEAFPKYLQNAGWGDRAAAPCPYAQFEETLEKFQQEQRRASMTLEELCADAKAKAAAANRAAAQPTQERTVTA